MQKFFMTILFSLLALLGVNKNVTPQTINEEKPDLALNSSSVVLIEPNSKRVIYEENKDEKHYPASMTKMMGMYIVLDNIQKGNLKWNDMVTASEYASSMGGTQIFLEPNEKMSVEDLFKSVCINSANDAITALGEHIAGSTPAFVSLMNKTAKQLGMNNTNFVNPTGFDDENHYTTPYDMALVASELVKFNEDLFRFTRLKEDYVRKDSSNPFWLVNTNKMLGHFDGLDGLKTGFTSKANYNLTATAKRNGVRLISVVMNVDTIAHRSQDTATLLNYGFNKMTAIKVFEKNEIITYINFNNSLNTKTPVIVKEDVVVVTNKEVTKEDLKAEIEITILEAPLKKGDCVGYLTIIDKDNIKHTYRIYVDEEVSKANFFDYLFKNFLEFLF